ncbi:MAG: MotA/TolQ/ExbB proton channel family protein, partial [bacterium]
MAPFVSAGPFALAIIVALFILSVVSWAIFFRKLRQYRQAAGQTKGFLSVFGYRRGLDDYKELIKMFPASPLSVLLKAAVEEWQILKTQFGTVAGTEVLGQLVFNITEAMERAGSKETDRLESYLSFLAITTMVAPFLGLLGTVQG